MDSYDRPDRTLKARVDAYERRLIMAALERAGGNQHRAAIALGVRPTTLNEKLRRLGIGVVRHVVDLERPDPDERRRLSTVLVDCGGRVSRAAARLGMSRARLRSELRRLGLGVTRSVEVEPGTPPQALVSPAKRSAGDELVGLEAAQPQQPLDHLPHDVVGRRGAGGEPDAERPHR